MQTLDQSVVTAPQNQVDQLVIDLMRLGQLLLEAQRKGYISPEINPPYTILDTVNKQMDTVNNGMEQLQTVVRQRVHEHFKEVDGTQ